METSKNWITEYYRKYRDSLLIIACSYTGSLSDAEDLVQSVFAKALLSYEQSGSFLYWANRVMRNDWINQQKNRKRESYREEGIPDVADSSEEPLSKLIRNESKSRLAVMISELPGNQRNVMIESVYLGRTDEQIAKDYGLSETNVRQIRSRAKKALIKRREQEDGDKQ
ncbi:MAG: RNA polymerase sigma factor [Lentihominibacter sp.]